ncbi:hypothetical protein Patl1_06952 [Pistacia atlantica]|uniref:Uncharacterized protein n=1 Tax=Pistacia atlantica TaxID=434234 RepID=A0ACC1AG65_9ROSI|nr:hypothetical protein Patl1_06952 [Pistacia atlantica]
MIVFLPFLVFYILQSHCDIYYNKSLMLCLVPNINHHTDCSVTYTFRWIQIFLPRIYYCPRDPVISIRFEMDGGDYTTK